MAISCGKSLIAPSSNSTSLSTKTWMEWWQTKRQQALPTDQGDYNDRIAHYPGQLATGYKRDIELRNGVSLTLHRYHFYQDLILTQWPAENTGSLEFVFNLSSISKYREGAYLTAGQHCLHSIYNPGCQQVFHLAKEPTLEVDIHIYPKVLQRWLGLDANSEQLQRLPPDLQRLLAGDTQVSLVSIQTITPAMQVALWQILDCPYHGSIKYLYLESKVLELLTLWLAQVFSIYDSTTPPQPTLSDEIERIYLAKDILIQQLDNPPSLVDLAHKVGLNDCTLKRQFRQVFGTTVFGYLYHYRMEQAQILLMEKRLPISEIAHTVGYNSPCTFSTAFRRKFGVSPKVMQKQ